VHVHWMHQLLPGYMAQSYPHTHATDRSLWFKIHAPIPWTNEMQQAFDKMSLLIAADALAANPDHNTRFDIFTKASDFQIGACIVQEGRPDAYFSCKIAEIYCYVETMISIVATLKEF